jgi:hypothetical protein
VAQEAAKVSVMRGMTSRQPPGPALRSATISARSCSLTRSSASGTAPSRWLRHPRLASACDSWPVALDGALGRPTSCARAIGGVRIDDNTSSQKLSERRQASMRSASLKVIMHADSLLGPDTPHRPSGQVHA